MEQIQRMLNQAFEKFPSVSGLIFHSDQGWQYQHAYFRNTLKEHGAIQYMSRKGNCYDNRILGTYQFLWIGKSLFFIWLCKTRKGNQVLRITVFLLGAMTGVVTLGVSYLWKNLQKVLREICFGGWFFRLI